MVGYRFTNPSQLNASFFSCLKRENSSKIPPVLCLLTSFLPRFVRVWDLCGKKSRVKTVSGETSFSESFLDFELLNLLFQRRARNFLLEDGHLTLPDSLLNAWRGTKAVSYLNAIFGAAPGLQILSGGIIDLQPIEFTKRLMIAVRHTYRIKSKRSWGPIYLNINLDHSQSRRDRKSLQ